MSGRHASKINGWINAHIISITDKITKYLSKYVKRFTIIPNNMVHAVVEQKHSKASANSSGKDVNAALEELRKRNPYLADFLIKHPDYFLEWPEDALGLFIWREWESLIGVNDKDRKKLEENIDAVINMKDAPKKFRNAAKIAKRLIEREKKILNIKDEDNEDKKNNKDNENKNED